MNPAFSSRSRLGLMVWLLAVISSLFVLPGCNEFEGEPILQWTDKGSGADITVRSSIHGGTTRLHMEVTRGGNTKRMVLSSDVQPHLVSLLHYNDWFLVLSGDYVIGGYDAAADRIVPANSRALPFTLHSRAGYVVQQVRVAEGEDPAPFEFEPRPDVQ